MEMATQDIVHSCWMRERQAPKSRTSPAGTALRLLSTRAASGLTAAPRNATRLRVRGQGRRSSAGGSCGRARVKPPAAGRVVTSRSPAVLRLVQSAGGGRYGHLGSREAHADRVAEVPGLAGRPGVGGSGNHRGWSWPRTRPPPLRSQEPCQGRPAASRTCCRWASRSRGSARWPWSCTARRSRLAVPGPLPLRGALRAEARELPSAPPGPVERVVRAHLSLRRFTRAQAGARPAPARHAVAPGPAARGATCAYPAS